MTQITAYLPHTDADRAAMLAAIGVSTMDDLLVDIPASLRLAELDLPAPLDEMSLTRLMADLGGRNRPVSQMPSFLGGGAYHHHIPAVVSALAGRGEFVTSYTPYQAEIAQGTLQVIYEFQSLMCALTDMDIANASLYDGATACAEAATMAVAATNRTTVVVAGTLHPAYRAVLHTYAWSQGLTLRVTDTTAAALLGADLAAVLDDSVAAVIVGSPNYLGGIEDQAQLAELAHAAGALYISCVNPLTLALLATPGAVGADIAVGDAQPFGNALAFGGPHLGFMAARGDLLRRMPGRIVGATLDSRGQRAYTLTFQTREQHIRREKATSNICSNHALNATTATIYLAYMGRHGLDAIATLCVQRAHYAAARITQIPGFDLLAPTVPFFHEFAVRCPVPASEINAHLLRHGMLGGIALSEQDATLADCLLLCVTEMNSRAEIDALAAALEDVAQ